MPVLLNAAERTTMYESGPRRGAGCTGLTQTTWTR